MSEVCKHCKVAFKGQYCSNCGAPKTLKRINRHYILNEISSALNFDKGFFYTAKKVLLDPGNTIRNYISEDRKKLVKPILFLIICSLIYTITKQFLNLEDSYINMNFEDLKNKSLSHLFSWFSKNYGYINIMMAVFVALWIQLFFKKYGYNYFEIFVLLCYTIGISMLLFSFLGLLESVSGYPILKYGASLIAVYLVWAIAHFFNSKKKFNYIKALLSYFLGMVTFIIVVVVIAVGLIIIF